MKKMKKGFTLIELLIVIAIIALLATVILVTMSSSRNKSVASDTKQSLDSLKSAIAICCASSTLQAATVAQADAGRDICTGAIGSLYPSSTALKLTTTGSVSYAVTTDCNGTNPMITATISNHPSSLCNGNWILSAYGGLTFPDGC